jgi:hypothetical protein
MTPAELLHKDAAKYANNRKEAYVEAMQRQEVILLTEIELNARWFAHYSRCIFILSRLSLFICL